MPQKKKRDKKEKKTNKKPHRKQVIKKSLNNQFLILHDNKIQDTNLIKNMSNLRNHSNNKREQIV
jgi:hypothetical protein